MLRFLVLILRGDNSFRVTGAVDMSLRGEVPTDMALERTGIDNR